MLKEDIVSTTIDETTDVEPKNNRAAQAMRCDRRINRSQPQPSNLRIKMKIKIKRICIAMPSKPDPEDKRALGPSENFTER